MKDLETMFALYDDKGRLHNPDDPDGLYTADELRQELSILEPNGSWRIETVVRPVKRFFQIFKRKND